ncbi:MAG TPA: hypothetical protein VM491_19680 [Burkholderiaceae bacterium]|nr:hypothetical protein [Burkholderiaceae bacterium]
MDRTQLSSESALAVEDLAVLSGQVFAQRMILTQIVAAAVGSQHDPKAAARQMFARLKQITHEADRDAAGPLPVGQEILQSFSQSVDAELDTVYRDVLQMLD